MGSYTPLDEWLSGYHADQETKLRQLGNELSLLDEQKEEDKAAAMLDLLSAQPDPTQFEGLPLFMAAKQWEQNKDKMARQTLADIEVDYSGYRQDVRHQIDSGLEDLLKVSSKVQTLQRPGGLTKFMQDYQAIPRDQANRSELQEFVGPDGVVTEARQVPRVLTSDEERQARIKDIAGFFGIDPFAIEGQLAHEEALALGQLEKAQDRAHVLDERRRQAMKNDVDDGMLAFNNPELIGTVIPQDSKANAIATLFRERALEETGAKSLDEKAESKQKWFAKKYEELEADGTINTATRKGRASAATEITKAWDDYQFTLKIAESQGKAAPSDAMMFNYGATFRQATEDAMRLTPSFMPKVQQKKSEPPKVDPAAARRAVKLRRQKEKDEELRRRKIERQRAMENMQPFGSWF